MDAVRIKFTPALVREVAKRAERITGGKFALSATGSDLGNGARYIDAHAMQVWYGPIGARQACAYYTAGAMAWLRETGTEPGDDGEFMLAVQAAYGRRRSGPTAADRKTFDRWEADGAARARALIEIEASK